MNGKEEECTGGSFRVNWERFDDEITLNKRPQSIACPPLATRKSSSPQPPIPEGTDSHQHDALGYTVPLPKKPEEQSARKTPPPLPKPYARKNTSKL